MGYVLMPVRLPREERVAFKVECARRGLRMSHVLRALVRAWLLTHDARQAVKTVEEANNGMHE